MKKKYLFALAALVLSFTVNAQIIEEDFESYPLGSMNLQNPSVWSAWSGQPNDGSNITVVDDIVFSGTRSGYIGPNSVQDCLLLLGNLTRNT